MAFHQQQQQRYNVELQDGEDVHSIRSMDLQDFAEDEEQPLPLQEHHLDRPIQMPPPRSHQHQLYASRSAYTNSSSDNDDMDTVSVDSKPASSSGGVKTEPRYLGQSSPNLQPSSVLALSSRKHASPVAPPALRRPSSAMALTQTAAYERKRGGSSAAAARSNSEERTGFARIYFENQNFTSSTVFKLFSKTTVLDVRKSMASKIKIPLSDFSFYVIVVVFPSADNAGSLSARTLRDEELILPLVERLNRVRSGTIENEESLGTIRPKPKHRTLPPVKFVLKDVRGAPLDLEEEEVEKKPPVEVQALHFPVLVGKGVHSGYLQKASVKDPNVWRKRWFIIKGDQLLYSKSSTNQREVTAVGLLNSYLAKPRPELRIAHAFELRTPRRVYQLCANSKEDYVGWVHALHVQISISTDNHRLYEAEIMITEDAVARSDEESSRSRYAEPSLLQQIISREDTLKIFRDFVYNTSSQVLLDTWIECELFRRSCIARENALLTNSGRPLRRSAKDEWDHLKVIMEAVQTLPMIANDELIPLRQSFFQTEQLSRRLSLAMHSTETSVEYPRVELIASIHQKIFKAIEAGPFQQFIMEDGYRLVLERIIGRIA